MKKKKSVKKSTKKKKVVVRKPIVESSRAIEESYVQEKDKIDRAIRRLERERLVAYIGLIDKRKSIVNLKKEKLNELERNLAKHIQSLKSQISRLKKKKREGKQDPRPRNRRRVPRERSRRLKRLRRPDRG